MIPSRIRYTKLNIVLEVLTVCMLVGMIVTIVSMWSGVPDKVPMHYNIRGEVDRWGDKSELIAEPVIAIALYAGLTAVSFFPRIWNVPFSITEKNVESIYGVTQTLLISIKLIVAATFWYLVWTALAQRELSPAFLPLELGAMAAVIIICILRMRHFARRR